MYTHICTYREAGRQAGRWIKGVHAYVGVYVSERKGISAVQTGGVKKGDVSLGMG